MQHFAGQHSGPRGVPLCAHSRAEGALSDICVAAIRSQRWAAKSRCAQRCVFLGHARAEWLLWNVGQESDVKFPLPNCKPFS